MTPAVIMLRATYVTCKHVCILISICYDFVCKSRSACQTLRRGLQVVFSQFVRGGRDKKLTIAMPHVSHAQYKCNARSIRHELLETVYALTGEEGVSLGEVDDGD